jgi:heat-inducible transcriptional repressor
VSSELNFRNRKILYAVLTEYIASGEPVGSRRLSKGYGINLSPATIRNVLSDLEDAGFLHQPHTSAGRVPTDQGFRVFVDALVQMREVGADDKEKVLSRLRTLTPGRDDVIRETGKLLSSLTGAAAVLTPPRSADETLAEVRFIALRPGQVLAVVVAKGGVVQNRVVPWDDAESRERINNYLSELVKGRTLRGARDAVAERVEQGKHEYEALRQRVQTLLDCTLEQQSTAKEQVVIEGQGRLFDRPEFVDVEKIRGYLRTFEDRERLLLLLDRTLTSGGIQVLIGSEVALADVEDVSVISASYRSASGAGGTLGVIGPQRMDYGKVVPLVDFTARAVGQLFGDDRGHDK